MGTRADHTKRDLIDKALRLLVERQPADHAEDAASFLRQFYDTVPPADIANLEPDQIYGAAMALLGYMRRRRPGTPSIRVFNPRIDAHGWQGDHTVIEVVNDDMPFLVDSVTTALANLDLQVIMLIHPILHLRRDAEGVMTRLLPADAPPEPGDLTESVMHLEITEQSDPVLLERIARELAEVLSDVRAAVEDWRPIQDRVHAITAEVADLPGTAGGEDDDTEEVRDFLAWLLDNHFTFLGHRNHSFTCTDSCRPDDLIVSVEDGLGILRDPDVLVFDELRHLSGLPAEVLTFLNQPTHLLITKASSRSRVHRPVHMDVVGVKRFGDDGRVVGIHLLVGLFTSNVYTNSPAFVPILRRKIERVMKKAGYRPFSHDGKRLLNILENLPRDELFQASGDKLLDMAVGILHLQERQHTALFLRRDDFERFVSCIVYVPRDRYDTSLRLQIQGILEDSLNGTLLAYYTQVADSPLARLHFIIRTEPGHIPPFDDAEIQGRIAAAARAWSDHLTDAIHAAKGEERGARLVRRYADAFPSFYRETFNAATAVFDMDRLEDSLERGRLTMNLYRPLEAPEEQVNFKVYRPDAAVPLSDILPMLENMGFRVVGEVPYEVRIQENGAVGPIPRHDAARRSMWIHDFSVRAEGAPIDVAAVRTAFHEAFAKVWEGEAENDGFNRLVIAAGLNWRDVVVLRAYARYLRQAAFTFSEASIQGALGAHPRVARHLIDLFHALLDPDRAHVDNAEAVTNRILEDLDHIQSPDEDRILRRYLNLIQATLRTNYHQTAEDGGPKPYLSFKIDSRRVEDLPLPRPMVEVWVYSPRVEAVHLRGGKVARGGIRWSDRREDFRTEVLGLMKAQMVKNAVIVPVGSKGGFVVKQPPPAEAGREAWLAEGIDCYRTFMRGLLDVTDTLDGAAVVPPPAVVRRDDDDPYLVVAADKGTASFSDIANGISRDYGFWLDDAFASGGSQGYDHKAMGITARGAWEAVKRHFREMGHDTQSEDFTVVGVGDMAGDVFGNGMLLSRHIKLIAAFNHLHIFIDPDPDPAASWEERKRLFDLPRSTWADYSPALISPGGGVFERRAKRIPLSPEMKAMTGLTADSVPPSALIKALLQAEADLLWFGGIGTYVKAAAESNVEVGDRANDSLRIDGAAVRARVVGEGANLAFTQRGRIDYALSGGPDGKGGRINTDAIDNSAGVDTSDHEVNIKILLNRVVGNGDLTMKQRNAMLESMTDEVAALVLRDNILQTQAISLMERLGVNQLDHQHRLMKMLEKAGRLDRAIEFLPDDEMIAERTAAKRGLTRPEISVVIAYSKIWLFDQILDSDLPDDPAMLGDLLNYFPAVLQDRYRDDISAHKLSREIIATHATNSMINRVGGTFVTQIMEKTGMPPDDIARAYIVARDAYALRALWRDVEALDNRVAADTQITMLLEANRLIERTTLWVLRHAPRPLDVAALSAAFRDGRAALEGCLEDICPADLQDDILARRQAYREAGVPDDLATTVAQIIILASTPDVVRLSHEQEVEIAVASTHYFAVGSRFGLGWLRAAADRLVQGASHWQKLAVAAVIDELYADQRAITAQVLRTVGPRDTPDEAIEAWAETCRPAVERAEGLVQEMRATGNMDLAMLTVASRQFGTLKG
jgi:glutamate dehydrogenase